MAMYLTNTPIYMIMLIGRWTSDAFLHYIRLQVQDFTRGSLATWSPPSTSSPQPKLLKEEKVDHSFEIKGNHGCQTG